MKNILFTLGLLLISVQLLATEKKLGGSTSAGRWVKVARIQNRNPIDGSEYSSLSGTLNVQTDFGQTGSEQYYAIFSFGSRGGIKPLLQEFGDAANRAVTDLSRIEWRVYTDTEGWHYLWLWQSNYSRYATFNYESSGSIEYWTFEAPPSNYTQVWSSIDGQRQNEIMNYNSINVKDKLAIGTTTTGSHLLAVDGSIGARKVKVEANAWSDFVFLKDYNLPTLQQVQQHIQEKGHLKGIPSANEVLENGFYLGEMDAKLLQKIEELTLYTIEQEEQLQAQNKKLEKAEIKLKEMNEMKERLTKLENLLVK